MHVCSGVFDMAHLWTVATPPLNYAVHIVLSACLKQWYEEIADYDKQLGQCLARQFV